MLFSTQSHKASHHHHHHHRHHRHDHHQLDPLPSSSSLPPPPHCVDYKSEFEWRPIMIACSIGVHCGMSGINITPFHGPVCHIVSLSMFARLSGSVYSVQRTAQIHMSRTLIGCTRRAVGRSWLCSVGLPPYCEVDKKATGRRCNRSWSVLWFRLNWVIECD